MYGFSCLIFWIFIANCHAHRNFRNVDSTISKQNLWNYQLGKGIPYNNFKRNDKMSSGSIIVTPVFQTKRHPMEASLPSWKHQKYDHDEQAKQKRQSARPIRPRPINRPFSTQQFQNPKPQMQNLVPSNPNEEDKEPKIIITNSGNPPASPMYGPILQQMQMSSATSIRCSDGFNTLIQDMTLISVLLSILSLIVGGVSLLISNFYNVFGSGFAVVFVGIPSLIVNVLTVAGITLPSTSPLIILMTITSIFDVLNNLFSIVPGSLFSDLLALISLLIGKVSLGIGALSSYPQLLQAGLQKVGLKDFIDANYGCSRKTLRTFVRDFLYGNTVDNENDVGDAMFYNN